MRRPGEEYESGVCNIGPDEIAHRLTLAHIGLLITLGFLALLHESLRNTEFDAFMQVLAACRPKTCASNPALVEAVASGRAALGYHVLGSYALRAARNHSSLAIAASGAAPLAVSRVAFIPDRASHPNAARLFLDYLLSQEGQHRLGDAGLFPIRRHVGQPAETVTRIPIDRGFEDLLDRDRRRRLLDRWHAAVPAPASP